MTGVVAEGNGLALFVAHAPQGAEQQELRSQSCMRIPAHARVLSQAEQVAAGPIAQHFVGQRQTAAGSIAARGNVGSGRVVEAKPGGQFTSQGNLFQWLEFGRDRFVYPILPEIVWAVATIQSLGNSAETCDYYSAKIRHRQDSDLIVISVRP